MSLEQTALGVTSSGMGVTRGTGGRTVWPRSSPGQYWSLEDSTAVYSLLAAWSLDLLPSQVKQLYLP